MVDDLGDGLFRIRLPLPWSGLDHVYSYALQGAPGWTLVDAGLGHAAGVAAWHDALVILGRPSIARLVITHSHTDHIGASADLVALTGCEVVQTAVDVAQARHWHDPDAVAATRRHLELHGCGADVIEPVMGAFHTLVADVHVAPCSRVVEDGDVLVGAGEPWRVVAAPGHADGQIALFGARSRRLITADAILAGVAPFVGVHATSRPDPLGDHFATLDRLARLDAVIGHGGHHAPMPDVAARAMAIRQHHEERLAAFRAALTAGPVTAYDVSLRVYGDRLGPTARRLALVESLAHLVHLERRGACERAVIAGGRVVFSAR